MFPTIPSSRLIPRHKTPIQRRIALIRRLSMHKPPLPVRIPLPSRQRQSRKKRPRVSELRSLRFAVRWSAVSWVLPSSALRCIRSTALKRMSRQQPPPRKPPDRRSAQIRRKRPPLHPPIPPARFRRRRSTSRMFPPLSASQTKVLPIMSSDRFPKPPAAAPALSSLPTARF